MSNITPSGINTPPGANVAATGPTGDSPELTEANANRLTDDLLENMPINTLWNMVMFGRTEAVQTTVKLGFKEMEEQNKRLEKLNDAMSAVLDLQSSVTGDKKASFNAEIVQKLKDAGIDTSNLSWDATRQVFDHYDHPWYCFGFPVAQYRTEHYTAYAEMNSTQLGNEVTKIKNKVESEQNISQQNMIRFQQFMNNLQQATEAQSNQNKKWGDMMSSLVRNLG